MSVSAISPRAVHRYLGTTDRPRRVSVRCWVEPWLRKFRLSQERELQDLRQKRYQEENLYNLNHRVVDKAQRASRYSWHPTSAGDGCNLTRATRPESVPERPAAATVAISSISLQTSIY